MSMAKKSVAKMSGAKKSRAKLSGAKKSEAKKSESKKSEALKSEGGTSESQIMSDFLCDSGSVPLIKKDPTSCLISRQLSYSQH